VVYSINKYYFYRSISVKQRDDMKKVLDFTHIINDVYLFNVEMQDVLHISRKLIDNGMVTEDAAHVRYHDSPNGSRGDKCAPWYRQMLQLKYCISILNAD